MATSEGTAGRRCAASGRSGAGSSATRFPGCFPFFRERVSVLDLWVLRESRGVDERMGCAMTLARWLRRWGSEDSLASSSWMSSVRHARFGKYTASGVCVRFRLVWASFESFGENDSFDCDFLDSDSSDPSDSVISLNSLISCDGFGSVCDVSNTVSASLAPEAAAPTAPPPPSLGCVAGPT